MEPFNNNRYIDIRVFEEVEPQRPEVPASQPNPVSVGTVARGAAEFLGSVIEIVQESNARNRAHIAYYQKHCGPFSQKYQTFWLNKAKHWH